MAVLIYSVIYLESTAEYSLNIVYFQKFCSPKNENVVPYSYSSGFFPSLARRRNFEESLYFYFFTYEKSINQGLSGSQKNMHTNDLITPYNL